MLVDQSDAIADSITLTLFERDAELYERIGPDLRVDVRESTRRHIRRGLEVLSGERPVAASARDLWRETGRRRARQGVPLELVLNAYTLGARVLWEALVARATDASGQIDEQVLLTAAGRSGPTWTCRTRCSSTPTGARARGSTARTSSASRPCSTHCSRVAARTRSSPTVRGPPSTSARTTRSRASWPCTTGPWTTPSLPPRTGSTGAASRRGGTSGPGSTSGCCPARSPTRRGWSTLFAPYAPGRMGVASCRDGIAGFAAAFQLATRAAETLDRGAQQVVSVAERLPEVLLAGSPQVAPLLLAETLGPVLGQPEPQATTLLDTLAAVLRHDGSPTHAAEELFCHRNTVIYRMKQIEQLTGRSVTNPRDRLLLELALMLRPS